MRVNERMTFNVILMYCESRNYSSWYVYMACRMRAVLDIPPPQQHPNIVENAPPTARPRQLDPGSDRMSATKKRNAKKPTIPISAK